MKIIQLLLDLDTGLPLRVNLGFSPVIISSKILAKMTAENNALSLRNVKRMFIFKIKYLKKSGGYLIVYESS